MKRAKSTNSLVSHKGMSLTTRSSDKPGLSGCSTALPRLAERAACLVMLIIFSMSTSVFAQAHLASRDYQHIEGLKSPAMSWFERGLERLNEPVTVRIEDTTLEDALSQIARAADLNLSYGHFSALNERRVSLEIIDVPVLNALYEALRGSGLGLQLAPSGRVIVVPLEHTAVSTTSNTVESEPEVAAHTVNGRVISTEDGSGLPGVNVIVKGTSVGAATDIDGYYTVDAPTPNDTLVFSFIGFLTQEVPVMGRARIDVALAPDVAGLDEVVVVGYGEQERGSLTGSVRAVNSEELTVRKVLRPSQALQGIVPGLTVTRESGQPGSDGGTLRIRGIGTLGDSNPLVIVDGVESSIDAVDPNNIESISVLKDAASASIYGSRAANGVILITTKRAIAEPRTQVSYNGYVGFQRPTKLPEFLGGYEFMTLLNEANENEGKTPPYSQEFIDAWLANHETNPDEYPNTDWQKEVLSGNAIEQYHNVVVSGGTDKIRVRGALSYMDQSGIIPNSGYDRYGLRLNSDINVSEKFDVAFDIHGRRSTRVQPSSGMYEIFYQMNRIPAIYAAQHSDGSWGVGWNGNNPKAMAEDGGIDRDTWSQAIIRLNAVYRLTDNFNLDLTFAPTYSSDFGHNFRKRIDIYDFKSKQLEYSIPQKSTLNMNNNHTLETTLNLLANYKKDIGRHHFKGLAGLQRITNRNDWFNAFRDNYPLPDYQQLNSGSVENMQNSGSASEWSLLSYFGRINYNWNGKYLLEGNVRYDGSSRFAKGNRFGLFPSVSAGWRISEESFMQSFGFLYDLKLRASWGRLGNQNIGLYPFASTIQLGMNNIFGGAPVDGAALTAMANPNISWETTEMSNFGVDLSLWNGLLDVTADYYIKNTYDILLRLPIPSIVGLTAPYQNAGKVRNIGWDLEVRHHNRVGDLDYSIAANVSDVHNEVMDLRGTGPYISGLTIIQEGEPINALYGYEADGLFQTQEEVDQHATQFGIVAPGDVRYVDQNGDGVINADDRVVLGNRIPRYTYGVTLNAAYRNFDFTLFIQGVGKRAGYLNNEAGWAFHNGGKVQAWQTDRWTPDNPDAIYPRYTFNFPNNYQNSSYWTLDASYLRVKTLQFGYRLPSNLLSSLPMSHLRIYLSGQDLFSRDSFRGYDVESGMGSGNVYPIMASYTFGVDLRF